MLPAQASGPHMYDGALVVLGEVFLAELVSQGLQTLQGQGMAQHLHCIIHLKACTHP